MTIIDLQNTTLIHDQTQARNAAITVKTREGSIVRLECVRDLGEFTAVDVVDIHSALQRLNEIDDVSCESINGDSL